MTKRGTTALVGGAVILLAGLALALHPLIHPDHVSPDVWVTRGLLAVGIALLFPALGPRAMKWLREWRGAR